MALEYTYNDGGRAAAGYKGHARDCVCRAISIITGKPYKQVYQYLAELNQARYGKKTARDGIAKKDRNHAMEQLGFKKMKLPKGPRPTYATAHHLYGDCVVSTVGHIAALKDGSLQDTFDGREYEHYETGDIMPRKAMSVWVYKHK